MALDLPSMKRVELLKMISDAAKVKGLDWEPIKTSKRGDHEKWRLGATVQTAIPRHRDINEITAGEILKDTEAELGRRWWK